MGTCLDWHGSAVQAAPPEIPKAEVSELALQWRRQYFLENAGRIQRKLAVEDIDQTLARALDIVLERSPLDKLHFTEAARRRMIQAWHTQAAWPEVPKSIQALQDELGLEVFVHANGTTRLQLNLTRSSGLSFNMLFSSELLGVYKPSIEAYEKALQLVKLRPEEVVMVAAHAYDLRGAQKAGMRTIYIHRWTDDVHENVAQLQTEFDAYLEDMEHLPDEIAKL
jgi:2-haloacid dehalogenase